MSDDLVVLLRRRGLRHLVCRSCGRLVDVDCAVGETPCLTAADDASFEIDEVEVIYWGRCSECLGSTQVSAND